MVLVCDRYSAYVKLAREHPGQFELAICWVHSRRDFVTLGRKWPHLLEWVDGIVGRIGRLYRRNAERLALWDPQGCLEGQSASFQAAQERLEAEFEALFEHADKELRALTAAAEKAPDGDPPDPRLGPLQSLLKHRAGLAVFVAKPFVPMDNWRAALRRPVVGCRRSLAGRAAVGVRHAGLAGIDLRRWLEAFLRKWRGAGRGNGRGAAPGLAAMGDVRSAGSNCSAHWRQSKQVPDP